MTSLVSPNTQDLCLNDAIFLSGLIHQLNYNQPVIGVANNGSDEERAWALESGMYEELLVNALMS